MGSVRIVRRKRVARVSQAARYSASLRPQANSVTTSGLPDIGSRRGNVTNMRSILRLQAMPAIRRLAVPSPSSRNVLRPGRMPSPSPVLNLVPGGGRIIQRKDMKRCADKHYAQGNKYLHATMKAGESGMMDMVKRLVHQGSLKRNWRLKWYTEQALKLNFQGRGRKYMHVGNCYVFPKQAKDPNVGSLPSLKTAQATKIRAEKTSLLNVVVATIYAEQTRDLPKQHAYIWHSIKKRVGHYEKPAKLYKVLNEYDAFNNMQARRNLYLAVMYLNGGKMTTLTRQKKFNPVVVDNIKKMVRRDWGKALPGSAGMFYFHWNEKAIPGLVTLWDSFKRYKAKPLLREKKAAGKFGKDHFGNVSLSKILRGTVPTQALRPVGTMYVFKLK